MFVTTIFNTETCEAEKEFRVIHNPDGDLSGETITVCFNFRPEDARLIAAAPDLLRACEAALDFNANILGECEAACDCVLHVLRAAILKATGKEAES
jgi:hypothetical protein